MMKKMMKDKFFETDVQHLQKFHDLHNDLPFFHEIWQIWKNLLLTCMIKKNMSFTKSFKTSIKSWISFEKNAYESLNLMNMLG